MPDATASVNREVYDVRAKRRAKRIDGMRLILQSSLRDDKVQLEVKAVGKEIEAINQALSGDRTYLGITDKAKLRERHHSLENKSSLLKEERELLRSLRVALADEERLEAEWSEQQRILLVQERLAAERAEQQQQQTSSPVHLRHDKGDLAAAAAAAAASETAAAEESSPSLSVRAFSSLHHSPYMSPSAPADLGVERFLKANADLGKAMDETRVRSATMATTGIRPIQFGNGDPHRDDGDVDSVVTT